MPVDQHYVEEINLWLQSQENCIKQAQENTDYARKEIELHEQAIKINVALILHYNKGIEKVKAELDDHILKNSE